MAPAPDITGEVVAEFLSSEGLKSLTSVAHEPGDDGGNYFAFLTVTRNRNNRQQPSNDKLGLIKVKAAMRGIKITFILSIDGDTDLEMSIRATLTANFEPYVRSAFSSVQKRKVFVWLDQKKAIPKPMLANIVRTTAEVIASNKLTLAMLSTLQDANIPSKLAILNAVRQLAPVTAEGLVTALSGRGFTLPSEHWLNNQLDKIRKTNELVRSKSGMYALTTKALKSLGTSKKRESPDISRLLALARSRN
jgi:hypothetical protein